MKIAIITNVTKDIGLGTATRIAEFLSGKAELYMSDDCVLPSKNTVSYIPYDCLWEKVDIAIVIGGDGTLLQIASRCAQKSIPVLGINLGKVGFLTEIETSEIENALERVIKGEYKTEKRDTRFILCVSFFVLLLLALYMKNLFTFART